MDADQMPCIDRQHDASASSEQRNATAAAMWRGSISMSSAQVALIASGSRSPFSMPARIAGVMV
jgi:hypothetical protein